MIILDRKWAESPFRKCPLLQRLDSASKMKKCVFRGRVGDPGGVQAPEY